MYDLLRPKNAVFTNNGTKNLGMVSREIYFITIQQTAVINILK